MKTAISVPDALFQKGEAAADQMQISRSELYSKALAEFLRHRSDDEITRKLNEVYSKETSDLDPVLHELAMRSIERDEW